MKQYKFILVALISIALVLMMSSCKKSDSGNPAGPDNTAAGLYGSGTISFNTNLSTVGNYNISGSFNPTGYGTSGSGLMCWYTASSNTAAIYGYQWRSSTDWDWTILVFDRAASSPLGTGTYSFADGSVSLMIIRGANGMSSSNGVEYVMDAGTANMTSFSSTGMKGNFSGAGVGVSSTVSGLPIQLTNGSFDVTFGTASVQP